MVNQYGSPITWGRFKGEGGVITMVVVLSGTGEKVVSDKLRGTIAIDIESKAPNGPTLYCRIAKATSTSELLIENVASTPAEDGSGTGLGVSWDANSSPKISKDNAFHDGQYNVTIFD